MSAENQYLDLLRAALEQPIRHGRNGPVRSMFGCRMEFDMADGYPLLTTKKVAFRAMALELLWFLTGDANARWIEDQGVTIWQQWGDPKTRHMGRIYGPQWRLWRGSVTKTGVGYVDQIQTLLDGLRKDPYGRRHIVTAWNPAELDEAALPPCHILWQCYIEADERLSLQLYQRSGDLFLGVPFNIASYSLLLHMICAMVGRKPGRFIHVLGDAHLYGDHEEQARLQLTRAPRAFPKISVANRLTLDGWTLGDFTLADYDPHPAISAPVSA